MSPEQVAEVTAFRLSDWGRMLVAKHATPAVLIAVGHDHVSGDVTVLVPDDATMQEVITLLRGVAVSLQRQEDSR